MGVIRFCAGEDEYEDEAAAEEYSNPTGSRGGRREGSLLNPAVLDYDIDDDDDDTPAAATSAAGEAATGGAAAAVAAAKRLTFHHEGGINELVGHLCAGKVLLHPEIEMIAVSEERGGINVQAALRWSKDQYVDSLAGFANGIRTSDGGSHLDGMKASITKVVNSFAKKVRILILLNIFATYAIITAAFAQNDVFMSGDYQQINWISCTFFGFGVAVLNYFQC